MKFLGPPLSEGPLPAVVYFSLSATESLSLDPFNQPALALAEAPLRVFSFDLPDHTVGHHSLDAWTEERLFAFAEEVSTHLASLPITRLAAAGLSRGALAAIYLASVMPHIEAIVGFAPLTKPLTTAHIHKVYNRKIRFYIGNCDTRVGTEGAFHFIHKCAAYAHEQRLRSSPLELIIGPSIGHKGHGTSPETFRAGATYLKEVLHV